MNTLLALTLLSFAATLATYAAFVAWFRPLQLKAILRWWSKIYSGWNAFDERWTRSETNYWYVRISTLLACLLGWTGVILMLFRL